MNWIIWAPRVFCTTQFAGIVEYASCMDTLTQWKSIPVPCKNKERSKKEKSKAQRSRDKKKMFNRCRKLQCHQTTLLCLGSLAISYWIHYEISISICGTSLHPIVDLADPLSQHSLVQINYYRIEQLLGGHGIDLMHCLLFSSWLSINGWLGEFQICRKLRTNQPSAFKLLW